MAGLQTHLIPKTGTIVPEYERRFYCPDESINSSVIAIADFTRQFLIKTLCDPRSVDRAHLSGRRRRAISFDFGGCERGPETLSFAGEGAPVLASVGSFEHRKGHLVLFEAVARLAAGPLPEISPDVGR